MIPVRNLSIPHVLQQNGIRDPQAIAAVTKSASVSWCKLMERSSKIANGLHRKGLVRGDRVALIFDNSLELLELIIGTMIAGGVVVPLSGLMTEDIIDRMLKSSGSKFLFAGSDMTRRFHGLGACVDVPKECRFAVAGSGSWSDYETWIAGSPREVPAIHYAFDDSISILYTSGTTGTPKGMEHSHLSRLLYPLVLGPLLRIDRNAKTILTTPMYHNGTWTTMLPTLYSGGQVAILDNFSVTGFQEMVEREHCTHAFMVPTQLVMLAADSNLSPSKLKSMRLVMVSGSLLANKTVDEIRSKLPHIEFCEIYGMGEGFMTFSSGTNIRTDKIGSVGRPIAEADTDIKIINDSDEELPTGEIGEIVGTSAFLLKGYYGEPELTRQCLWHDRNGRAYLRSGDLGRFDSDGFLYIAGRKKDMIISGGVKIYASDLEDVFMRHPDVSEVAAVSIPHEKWGETPLMLAIMKPGSSTTERELMEWGNRYLGKAQRVSRVEFRDSFPRNSLAKIVKRALRDPYWQSAGV
jgi:long-chain acyl-CoA synthetase